MNASHIIALLYTLCCVLNLVFGQPTTATCDESCTARQQADTIEQQLHQILGHLQRLDRKVNEFEVKLGQLEQQLEKRKNVSGNVSIENANTECTVKSIGPVEVVANLSSYKGTWMKDVAFPDSQKVYVIQHHPNNGPGKVRLYTDTTALGKNVHGKEYTLPTYISGSGMVYNSTVYYNVQHTTTMYQYNMETGQSKSLFLTEASRNCSYRSIGNDGGFETDIDIEVDERGLWFIYGSHNNCQFVIIKIDPTSFTIDRRWSLPWSRPKQTTGQAFMKCGKLYIIDNATNKPTYVAYVFDTESGQGRILGSTEIVYPNTYPDTWYMSFNINDNNLYVWHSDYWRLVRYLVM